MSDIGFNIDQALLLVEVQAAKASPLTTTPQPGSVVSYDGGSLTALVLIDGDSAAIPIKSTIGAVTALQRVMVEFYDPHGVRIVGAF